MSSFLSQSPLSLSGHQVKAGHQARWAPSTSAPCLAHSPFPPLPPLLISEEDPDTPICLLFLLLRGSCGLQPCPSSPFLLGVRGRGFFPCLTPPAHLSSLNCRGLTRQCLRPLCRAWHLERRTKEQALPCGLSAGAVLMVREGPRTERGGEEVAVMS